VIRTAAGDNIRAATAQKAYLVQYAKSTGIPKGPLDQAVALHNGVIGVYADLFTKNALHPHLGAARGGFNPDGRPARQGDFDGVIVAPSPWTFRPAEVDWLFWTAPIVNL
jgi:hypothetical protein